MIRPERKKALSASEPAEASSDLHFRLTRIFLGE